MPCICYGAVLGKEEFDRHLETPAGQEVLIMLRIVANKIKDNFEVDPECYIREFRKVWIEAFEHMLLDCPEHKK